MDKDFETWSGKKQILDAKNTGPSFDEAQIWWCSVGVNVGFEILGKSGLFTRPVLILTKYSSYTFFALPMTSRRKNSPFRYHLDFQKAEGSIILDQGRTMDSRRLSRRMGELPEKTFLEIKQAFIKTL